MRELTVTELEVVAGGAIYYDSADWGDPGCEPEIDHALLNEAEARAVANGMWIGAQIHSQLDAFAKSVGLPNFTELQRQASIQQQQTCQVDPTFSAMMNSPSFNSVMNNLISLSQATGFEYAINYYGNGHWSSPYTSNDPRQVAFSKLDLFNFWYGWADVAIHTHFNAEPGLSLGTNYDIGAAERTGTPLMAVDFTQPSGTQYYCYNPNTN